MALDYWTFLEEGTRNFRKRTICLPKGAVVAIVAVLPLLTLVLSRVVSRTQVTQVSWETTLVGTWYATLLEETSNS